MENKSVWHAAVICSALVVLLLFGELMALNWLSAAFGPDTNNEHVYFAVLGTPRITNTEWKPERLNSRFQF